VFLSKSKLDLPQVTLVGVAGIDIKKTLYALWRSQIGIKFNQVMLITDSKFYFKSKKLDLELTDKFILDSLDAYSKFIVYELHKYIKSEYVLIVQADGYVLHPKKWSDSFLQYDYIGAPWRIKHNAYIDPFNKHQRVGNGGFSLRSRKLLQTPIYHKIEWNINDDNFYKHMGVNSQAEDGIICVHNRHLYEKAGNVFAPLEVALKFSCEQKTDEYDGRLTFGFHKNFPHLFERICDLFYRTIFNFKYHTSKTI
jgi:Protein of unknown function (DUF5672)